MNKLGLVLSAPNGYMSAFNAEMIPQGYLRPRTFRSVINARTIDGARVVQDYWETTWNTPNIGWPVGLWNGGTWEDPVTGTTGKILAYTHENNRAVFTLDRSPGIKAGSALFVYQTQPAPETWMAQTDYHPLFKEYYNAYQKQTNPLAPDALDWRGEYTLDAEVQGGTINLVFAGITKEITGVVHETFRVDANPPGIQTVAAYLVRGGPVTIKRLSLKRAGVGGITQAAFDALRSIKPRVLRYWQGQHGQSLDGMVSGAFHGYSPRDARATRWEQPLPDFLDLCEALGATPWVVVPSAFTDDEVVRIAYMLPPGAFIEYGNECWGSNVPGADPFTGASLAFQFPAVAQRKTAAITRTDITVVMGGHTNLQWTRDMRKVYTRADRVALGAYYTTTDLTPRTWEILGETPLYYEFQSHRHTAPHELNGTQIGAVAGVYHLLDAPDVACFFTAFQFETQKGVFIWGLWENTATYQPRPLAVALQGLTDFEPVRRVDNLTWEGDVQTLYLSGIDTRNIPETKGLILTSSNPAQPNALVAWADWQGTQMPTWSIVLGEAVLTELVVTVPKGVKSVRLEIEQ